MFFEYGFRIFFLLAFSFAAVFMSSWILIYPGLITIQPFFDNVLTWHGHEMIYGFSVAVVAGFLLTAVATWTSTPAIKGKRLIILSLLWLMGRLVVTFNFLNPFIVSFIDLSFIPVLMLFFADPLIATKNTKNYILLGFLGLLFLCNAMIHLAHHNVIASDFEQSALYASVGVILLFITLIGGRVIPFFTVNALNRHGLDVKNTPQGSMDQLAIATVIIFIMTIIMTGPMTFYTGYAALAVAVVHGWRMRLWHTQKSLIDPLLWILHSSYLWMIVGMSFWFYSTVVTNYFPISISVHLITIGCIGSLCLGMMARVSLGHTGRPLVISKLITLSFILIQVSIVSRLLGAFFPNYYMQSIAISGILWIVSFVLYGIVYTPILYHPRIEESSPFKIIQR